MREIILWLLLVVATASAEYNVGVGIADVTGPSAEIVFMGYGKTAQKGRGIHLRQFSRAFVFDNGESRLLFASIDVGMIGPALREDVIKKLQTLYGDVYHDQNVMLSGTHTHSAPGGFLQDLLFDLSTLGFVPETYNALLSGIVRSIRRAHESMVPARLFFAQKEVDEVNVNRSPTAYRANPEEERQKYTHDVDKTLTQLKIVGADGEPLGAINWFAVHPTSMNNTNRLVSSDNVGFASVLLEKYVEPDAHPGKAKFVGAFASSNLGDVSPNTRGPHCEGTGHPCDLLTSSCAKGQQCFSSGPGQDMFSSTRIIALALSTAAKELLSNTPGKEITGQLKTIHQWVDMPKQVVEYADPVTGTVKKIHGCLPAMGYSFAAGTTDGPGAFSFKQGTLTDNALWNTVRNVLARPTPEMVKCHGAKPILIATGLMKFPYRWQPEIVSTQVALLGNLAIACVPGEFTTMAGRRLRSAIADSVRSAGGPQDVEVVIAGLCNVYSDYIVTPEEYQIQRYEGASTIYGPNTLLIHLNQYKKLTEALVKGEALEPGQGPGGIHSNLMSLTTPVVFDMPMWGQQFGSCLEQPKELYKPGETVQVKFVSGNPRNNLMHGGTYLGVEKYNPTKNEWIVVATDAYWDTIFSWERTNVILGYSQVTITWTIPQDMESGKYRITHHGHYKYIFGGIQPYHGSSNNFTVEAHTAKWREDRERMKEQLSSILHPREDQRK